MLYRSVKKTGWDVSALSFGCMRFADDETAAEAVNKAIELGVNYFDVAPCYGWGTAERRLGLGLKGISNRNKLFVTAKSSPGNGGDGVGEYNPKDGFGIRTTDQVRKQIELSMNLIGVDHFDMYHLWACHGDAVFEEAIKPGGFLEGVEKAREEGLINRIGITTHMDSDGIIRYLSRYDFDMVTLPFHLKDTSRKKAIDFCAEKGIGVIAMNPLSGGAIAKPSPVLGNIATQLGFESMIEAALRYIISYPGVTSALAGITYADQASIDASAIEKGIIEESVSRLLELDVKELYANIIHICTGCGYCGECPEGIDIPGVLDTYSNLLVPSLADSAVETLVQKLTSNADSYDASKCAACGNCEAKCPNKIPISELMTKANMMWHRGEKDKD